MLLSNVPNEPKKMVSFSFTPSINDELSIRAARLGLSRSAYVRLALLDYFKKEDNKQN